jgi:hypothetical protein
MAAIDLAVRGAAEIVQAALRRGDRAGVLALGGRTRWLGPDIGGGSSTGSSTRCWTPPRRIRAVGPAPVGCRERRFRPAPA